MVTAADERAAAVDKTRGQVGPSLDDLAIGSPVPFPAVQPARASDVRAGYLGLYIAPVNKQPAPAYLLNRTVNVKGVPGHSTERWYWSVTLNAVTAAQQTTATQMHLPCRVTLPQDCLGVTSCPPARTPYTHDVRIFYISSLSMLFDICEQCWYQRYVTSIEIGGDVLALGIRFI